MKRCRYCHYANSEENTVCYHCNVALDIVIPHEETKKTTEEPVKSSKRKSNKE